MIGLGARGLGARGNQSANPSLLNNVASGPLRSSRDPQRHSLKPTAKRVIYLFLSGGPSHIDLYDYHPKMREFHGTELPDSIRNGQRITGMTSGQKSFPCVAPMFEFTRHGQNGSWFSDAIPNIAGIADEITLVKSVHTERSIMTRPSLRSTRVPNNGKGKPSWGLGWTGDWGAPTKPARLRGDDFKGKGNAQALYDRLWGSGFLPSKHQE